jgi:hypothetical protein
MRTMGHKMVTGFLFLFLVFFSIESTVIQVDAAVSEYPNRPITSCSERDLTPTLL